MKDKIILWLDAYLLYFGLAKFLQDKYECELYAIIDVTDKPKKFFQQQQIVNFSKVWYLHDYISKTKGKPDLKYLSSFEEKYGINLWLIAYNERIFYRFNRYYKFTTDEVLSILEQECKLFENVLDKTNPDFLLMKTSDLHQNHLFYEICKARGIKILLLTSTNFGYRRAISKEMNKIDNIENFTTIKSTNKTIQELYNYLKGHDLSKQVKTYHTRFQNSKLKLLKAVLHFLFMSDTNKKTHYTYYGRTKLRVLIKETIYILKKRYREFFINQTFAREIDFKNPFIYFPLHIDQERVLLVGAPFYTNQLEIIKNIVQSLPVGYHLCIKEHPDMTTRGWRETSYYKQIMNLPNVHLLHPSVTTDKILKNCALVISIAGTASLEALFYEKPSIILTDVSFAILPSVYRLKTVEEFPYAIRSCLQKKVDLTALNQYVNFINQNSFEFDELDIMMEILERFYMGGYLANVCITTTQMESFLQEYSSVFEKLTEEFIKKLNTK